MKPILINPSIHYPDFTCCVVLEEELDHTMDGPQWLYWGLGGEPEEWVYQTDILPGEFISHITWKIGRLLI